MSCHHRRSTPPLATPITAIAVLAALCLAGSAHGAGLERQADGVRLTVGDGLLRLGVCADDVVRVSYAKDPAFFERRGLATAPQRCDSVRWQLSGDAHETTLSTAQLRVRVDLETGALTFLDLSGQPILAEKSGGGRAVEPAEVQGESTFHVRQEWEPDAEEALYGLGQQQLGLLNIKGYDLDLWQHNGTVSVPFLVSSRGYGILWDNTSYTRFGDLRPFEPIPAARLTGSAGKPGGLTGSYYAGARFERLVGSRLDPVVDIAIQGNTPNANQRIHPALPAEGAVSVRWEGQLQPETTGEHLFQTFSNSGVRLWIDDLLVIDHWRQGWLPWIDVTRLRLEAKRRYRLRLEWSKDQGMETMRLLWKPPPQNTTTSLWSEVGEGVDYYFVYGPELDKVVAGYRRLTGDAPLPPRWAFGLWQSRQRYATAQESLDVLEGYRSRGIPIDNIVQDWFYWKEDAWGSHQFDPERFPDPEGWIRAIHERYHAQLMISVWGKFYPGTENFEALHSRGFLYEPNLREGLRDWVGPGYPYTFYDAFSDGARQLFWSLIERALFSKGFDAWWLDSTEPDLLPTPTLDGQRTHMHPTALGTGARMLNAYSLVNSRGVYEGLRKAAPDRRAFILTRSGFAGQQRYAAATWSGDVSSTWTALRGQIPAGLGFSISGLPYWTMDVGGFAVPPRFSREKPTAEDLEEWRELNTRWFQFGTFVPLLRVHGEAPPREMWRFGGESHPAYQTQLKFDRLRYRLLPYVYSLAAGVTRDAGTLMRALVMDFRDDLRARELIDEYMFGPAFLVSPVTTYKARQRPVYLPQAVLWYDFWTGAAKLAGQTIQAAAPYESLPVYVRAGSIVPCGPELQYTGEKPTDPITLYVYAGADGGFVLYEDEGLNYNYERGVSATIPLTWRESTRTLTIGKRQGTFPGMPAERTFEVVLVARDRPVGFSFTPHADKSISYSGEAVDVTFE
jgi:alpha-D-xyloside xylohydrolase